MQIATFYVLPERHDAYVNDRSWAGLPVLERVVIRRAGWEAVRYDGRYYQLFGGSRTPLFIDSTHPTGRS